MTEFIHDARLCRVDQVFEVGHVITHSGKDGDVILVGAKEWLHGAVDAGGNPDLFGSHVCFIPGCPSFLMPNATASTASLSASKARNPRRRQRAS